MKATKGKPETGSGGEGILGGGNGGEAMMCSSGLEVGEQYTQSPCLYFQRYFYFATFGNDVGCLLTHGLTH